MYYEDFYLIGGEPIRIHTYHEIQIDGMILFYLFIAWILVERWIHTVKTGIGFACMHERNIEWFKRNDIIFHWILYCTEHNK